MKKIVALVLILVFAFAAVSCNDGDGVGATSEKILAMYNRKAPTKSVTVATYKFAETTLTDTTILVTGKIDGTKAAAELTEITQRLRTVEDGSNAEIVGPIVTTETVKEFYEGFGVRSKVDGGAWSAWDESAANFAANKSIALNLNDSKLDNINEDGNKVTFTVAAANTESVFGKAVSAPISVTITHDGACVVGVVLEYVEAATADTPEMTIKIEVEYTYDIETITIG